MSLMEAHSNKMNEFAILTKLITRTGTPMGAGVEDMLDALGLPEHSGRHILFERLAELYEQFKPMGLVIKHNPIDHVFYLDTSSHTDSIAEETVLSDRLAATLLVVITLSYQEGGWVTYNRVKEFRRKSMRSLREDFKELSSQGYLEIESSSKKVRPGVRVAFEIDYETFFRELAKKVE